MSSPSWAYSLTCSRLSRSLRVGSRMSPPTQKARSPAPVSTTTPTAGSSDAPAIAAHSSRRVRVRSALSLRGRLIVIVARPPAAA